MDTIRIVGSESHIISEESHYYIGPEIYEKAMPAGIVSPKNKLCYPIAYTYTGDRVIENIYQGTAYLGAANINNCQVWMISGLCSGEQYRFSVVSSGVGGEYLDELETKAAIEGGSIDAGSLMKWNETENLEWNIVFTADCSTIKLKLDHNETGEYLHYVNIKNFRIEPVKENEF